MKKTLIVTFTALLLSGILPNLHIHDKDCGYDPKTGTGCIYEQIKPQDGGRFGD